MLASIVDHVIGVDPDRDSITAAVIEASTTAVVATARFCANRAGYDEVVVWADSHSAATERAWAIEGSGSYGRGLAGALARAGEWVIEFDRATTKASKDGAKTDELDAIRAGREVLGRRHLCEPRSHDGAREAMRVHQVARAAAVRARTAAISELKALVVTAPETLRDELRGLTRTNLLDRCCGFRHSDNRSVADDATRIALRAIARRIGHLSDEITEHDAALKTLLTDAAPQLLAETGVGHVTAAAFYVAWSHKGRCRSEAAYARLAGAAPIPATSGQTTNRHRLNHGGDRQLNRALYHVAVTRRRCCPTTQTYIARRTAQGKTERDAIRCIKRYIARRIWRLLEHPPTPT